MTDDLRIKHKLQQEVLSLKEKNFQLKKIITELKLKNTNLEKIITDLDKKQTLHQGGIMNPKRRS